MLGIILRSLCLQCKCLTVSVASLQPGVWSSFCLLLFSGALLCKNVTFRSWEFERHSLLMTSPEIWRYWDFGAVCLTPGEAAKLWMQATSCQEHFGSKGHFPHKHIPGGAHQKQVWLAVGTGCWALGSVVPSQTLWFSTLHIPPSDPTTNTWKGEKKVWLKDVFAYYSHILYDTSDTLGKTISFCSSKYPEKWVMKNSFFLRPLSDGIVRLREDRLHKNK